MPDSLAFKHHTADAVTFVKNYHGGLKLDGIVYPVVLLAYSFLMVHRITRIGAGNEIWLFSGPCFAGYFRDLKGILATTKVYPTLGGHLPCSQQM